MDDLIDKNARELRGSSAGLLRKMAARSLGQSGDPRAVEPLLAALADADPDVVAEVAQALGRVGDLRALEPLEALLQGPALGMAAERAVAAALETLYTRSAPRPGADPYALGPAATDASKAPGAAAQGPEGTLRIAIQPATPATAAPAPARTATAPPPTAAAAAASVAPPRQGAAPTPDTPPKIRVRPAGGPDLREPAFALALDGAVAAASGSGARPAGTSASDSGGVDMAVRDVSGRVLGAEESRRAMLVAEALSPLECRILERGPVSFEVEVALGKRQQRVRIGFDFEDSDGDRCILVATTGGKATTDNYYWALRLNLRLVYGKVAIHRIDGEDYFVLCHTLLEAHTHPTELRKAIEHAAHRGDWIERQLHGSVPDRF